MACIVTTAITKPCGDGIAGIKKLWAVEHPALDTMTLTAGVVTAMALDATKVFLGWDIEVGAAKMTAAIQRNRDNGTLFYEQKIAVKFQRYEVTKRNEIKILATADLAIVALDRNGKYWLLGRENGMSLDSGSADSGQAMGDFNGFELSFTGMEGDLPVELNSSVVTSLALS